MSLHDLGCKTSVRLDSILPQTSPCRVPGFLRCDAAAHISLAPPEVCTPITEGP